MLLWWWSRRSLLLINILVLVALAVGALLSQPSIFLAAFNPATLTIAMIALSLVGYVSADGLPTSASCIRSPEK